MIAWLRSFQSPRAAAAQKIESCHIAKGNFTGVRLPRGGFGIKEMKLIGERDSTWLLWKSFGARVDPRCPGHPRELNIPVTAGSLGQLSLLRQAKNAVISPFLTTPTNISTHPPISSHSRFLLTLSDPFPPWRIRCVSYLFGYRRTLLISEVTLDLFDFVAFFETLLKASNIASAISPLCQSGAAFKEQHIFLDVIASPSSF